MWTQRRLIVTAVVTLATAAGPSSAILAAQIRPPIDPVSHGTWALSAERTDSALMTASYVPSARSANDGSFGKGDALHMWASVLVAMFFGVGVREVVNKASSTRAKVRESWMEALDPDAGPSGSVRSNDLWTALERD